MTTCKYLLVISMPNLREMVSFAEEQIEQDKKKIQSMADVMKNPTKIVLLQVCVCVCGPAGC